MLKAQALPLLVRTIPSRARHGPAAESFRTWMFNCLSRLYISSPVCDRKVLLLHVHLPHQLRLPVEVHDALIIVPSHRRRSDRHHKSGSPGQSPALLTQFAISLKILSAGVAREREVGEAVIIQARGKRCQKRIVGAGRPVREATNIAANVDGVKLS